MRLPTHRLLALAVAFVVLPAATASATVLPALDTTEQIGPSTTVRHLQYPDVGGWVDAFVMSADLNEDGVKLDLLHPPAVAQGMALTAQVANSGPGVVGGVNADFFDINASYAAQGVELTGGQLLKSAIPLASERHASVVTEAGKAMLTQVAFTGSVTVGDAPFSVLDGVNLHDAAADSIVAFTPAWGTYSRARATTGAASTTEVLVRDGAVVSVAPGAPGAGTIPGDGFYLVGREAGATALRGLQVGDRVAIDYRLRTSGGQAVRFAVGGGAAIVKGGQVQNVPANEVGDPLNPNPRTAIGFNQAGTRVVLAVVDGRRAGFPGITQRQLGELLVDAGAWDAQNLDGGGSSELVARPAGTGAVTVRNAPSDGRERADANGVGVFVRPGNGTAATLLLDPDGDVTRSSGTAARVFPGAERRFRVATAVDSGWGPAPLPAGIGWSSSGGTIDAAGRLRAPDRPGEIRVTAAAGAATGSTKVQVLGEPVAIEPSSRTVAFGGPTGSATGVTLTARDADGFTAPLDAGDTTMTYDQAKASVTVGSDGAVRITPKAVGSTVLRIARGSATTELGITVGAAAVPALANPPVADRLVAPDAGRRAPWSFAVLANPGIATATDAGADAAVGALARIRSTGPDFVLVDGGVTLGGGSQATAARTALERGGCQISVTAVDPPAAPAGKLPCVVLPGDSDRSGGALPAAFTTAFGAPWRTFDHQRTRFVLLDSSAGTLLGTGYAQLAVLDDALDGAAQAAGIDNVVVVTARPTVDPLKDAARTLADPRENTLLDQALVRFAAASGKPVSLLSAGARVAAVRRHDGVAQLAVPPVTGPRGSAGQGGVTGWTRVAVDAGRPDGLTADVHAFATSVQLEAPTSVAVDATATVSGALQQDGRTVPLGFPITSRWSGSTNLAIGSGPTDLAAARAAGRAAIFDPATRVLTGLHAGTVTLAVEADAAAEGGAPARSERTLAITDGSVPPDPGPVVDPGGLLDPPLGNVAPPGRSPGPALAGTGKPAVSNAVSIRSAKGSFTAFSFSIRVAGPGKLTVSARVTPKRGRAVAAGSRTVAVRKAGTVAVTLRPSARVRRAIAKGKAGRAAVRASVRFAPTGGRAKTVTRGFTATARSASAH